MGIALSVPGQAEQCVVKSPEYRIALLELYTSEGCSSCPPADAWFSRLSRNVTMTNRLVLLSLHVDYWNYIGWKDPYSSSLYTSRQREIAHRNRLNTIYTPQVVLDGRDFRSWRNVEISRLLDEINRRDPLADISIAITVGKKDSMDIRVDGSLRNELSSTSASLVVAVYESGLTSRVSAGENKGRILSHDHVVRQLFAPLKIDGNGRVTRHINLEIPDASLARNFGIAAFIEDNNGDVLQALATDLVCK